MGTKKVVLLCFVAITLGTCHATHAQVDLDSLRHSGDKREQYFKAFRLVWSVTTTYTSTPLRQMNPQALRQEAESLERALRARGVRDVTALRQQIEQEQARERQHQILTSRGDWEVEWGNDEKGEEFLFISGIRKFHEEVVRFQAFYGEGWGMQIGTPTSGRPGPPPVVWCCTGHCARYPAPNDGGLDVGTDELSIIVGLNALQMNGQAGWEVVGETKDSVYLRKRDYLDTYGVFEINVALDLKHGGIPSCIVKRNGAYEGRIEVTRYTQVGGYWLPENIKSVFRTHRQFPGMTRERTWRLRGVQPKRGVSLREIDTLQTIRHWGVRDLRAYGCNLTLGEVVSGDKDVYYQWTGRLPTIDEVKAMLKTRQQRHLSGISSSAWWRFIPPLLLTAIGILWYWRLKRAEGRR